MDNKFKFFKNKKILTILPHEDDELNLIGGLLNSNYIDKDKLYITYVTNGDYYCKTETRVKEVTKSLKRCGVKKENLIFLGYCDQQFSENTHIYMTDENSSFESKNSRKETYFISGQNEYAWLKRKKHSQFNKEALINDLETLIMDIMPDIIFVNDFDSHPDHRCISLCFDSTIGKVLKKTKDYFPNIYKGFCYPTEYNGYDDYDNINLLSTKFKKEKNNEFDCQNPYYSWKERIRFCVGKETFKYSLLTNKLYKCLLEHKSQLLLRKYKSIINSDQVFWQRQTNNLCLTASIEATSGNTKYLNDFMTFDCENIMHKDTSFPIFKNVSWIPKKEDKEKKITIKLKNSSQISEIKFYQNSISKGKIKDINVKFDNGEKKYIQLENKLCNTLNVNTKEKINNIEIEVVSQETNDAGFSEIEIIPSKEKNVEFLKILIDDNFTNDIYYVNDLKYKIDVYCYNGSESLKLSHNNFIFKIDNKIINYKDLNNYIDKDYTLKIALKDNEEIYDEVKIKHIKPINKVFFILKKNTNKIILKKDVFVSRVHNKIKRVLKRM